MIPGRAAGNSSPSRVTAMTGRSAAGLTAFLLALLFSVFPGNAAADGPADPRVKVFLNRPLAEKLASPRQTIQTLCFAIEAYNRIPEMIADAVACLEFDPKDKLEQGSAELLAIQLEEVLDELSLPFQTLFDGANGRPVVFYQEGNLRIVLARGKDGLWRFDRTTVAMIPALRRAMSAQAKTRQQISGQLREGLEDPTATLTSFLAHASAGDYESAALRLDLADLPAKQQRVLGPYLAWKLAAVMQRRGFLYREDVPIDPAGPPYTWSADVDGRITVERVRQPGGKDTWLFSRATVSTIEAMWRKVKDRPPDVRYVVLGTVVPPPPEAAPVAGDRGGTAGKPASVPEAYSSPRRMLRAFYRAVDVAEYDDARQQDAYSFLDLSQFAPEDLPFVGPKRVAMLEAVLRKLGPDLASLPDHWSAAPQALNGPGRLRVEIVRQPDGCWRFSRETVAQLPAMYDSIGGQEKAEGERTEGLGNARQVLASFFTAINQRADARAARCLDLSELPLSARADLGPVLAFKLKYVIDRLGWIYLQEISNDPAGPRVVLYRGPIGRLVLARREEGGSPVWGFSAETVRQIEAMFESLHDQPVCAQVAADDHLRVAPEFWHQPGIWLRLHMPAWLRGVHLGLEIYQWLGLLAIVTLAWAASALVRRLAWRLVDRALPSAASDADRRTAGRKLRSLQALVAVLLLYELFGWLDLPAAVAAHLYVVQRLLLTAVLTWTGLQWADLVSLFYRHSKRLQVHHELGDLVVPFVTSLVKIAVILTAITYLVYQFGKGEALTRFLAGIGLLGLAVSLAAQDSLKNLFGTLLLIGDRSFRIGDRLIVGDKEGVVEHVGFRSTRLRTPEDSMLMLPNALLAGGVIDNLGMRAYRLIRLPFSAASTTPLERLEALRDGVRKYLAARKDVDPGRVHVHIQRIGAAGIELEATTYFDAPDIEAERQAREQLVCELLRLAGSLQVELALAKE